MKILSLKQIIDKLEEQIEDESGLVLISEEEAKRIVELLKIYC